MILCTIDKSIVAFKSNLISLLFNTYLFIYLRCVWVSVCVTLVTIIFACFILFKFLHIFFFFIVQKEKSLLHKWALNEIHVDDETARRLTCRFLIVIGKTYSNLVKMYGNNMQPLSVYTYAIIIYNGWNSVCIH